jgi:hypothetical protein
MMIKQYDKEDKVEGEENRKRNNFSGGPYNVLSRISLKNKEIGKCTSG